MLLLHDGLRIHMAERLRIRRTTRHTLPAHLPRHPTHLSPGMLSTHPAIPAHRVRARLHPHHRARLRDMRCTGSRCAWMAHLLHLRRIHRLARRHDRVAVRRHARMHARLRLICSHHLAHIGRVACASTVGSPVCFFVLSPADSSRPALGRLGHARCIGL